ncbi:MAG: glycosyltransferase family 4 protein [Patescibacteria group bacterium]
MKIIQIAPYYLPHYGGVEKHVEEISKLLIVKGHEVIVVTLQNDRKLKKKDQRQKVKIFRIPLFSILHSSFLDKFKYKLSLWSWVWHHREIFTQSDIVHVHDVFWWILPIWLLVRRKIFITFHGWEAVYPVPLKNKLQRWIWSKLSQARIHVGQYIEEFYWDKADKVIYGGVETISPLLSGSARQKSDLLSHKERGILNTIFVGRLERVNEIESYICMINELKKANFKIKVLWLGDGSLRKECEEVGRVLGVTQDQEKYIRKADVVFANSYLSILKAQAMGKVVVSLYSHKLKQRYLETYPGSKYMIIQDNTCTIEKMIALLTDKKKILKVQKAAKDFASKMTWKKVLKTYGELWS